MKHQACNHVTYAMIYIHASKETCEITCLCDMANERLRVFVCVCVLFQIIHKSNEPYMVALILGRSLVRMFGKKFNIAAVFLPSLWRTVSGGGLFFSFLPIICSCTRPHRTLDALHADSSAELGAKKGKGDKKEDD